MSQPLYLLIITKFESRIKIQIFIIGKGGKNRRRGKNENENEKRELVFKEDGQGKINLHEA